MNMGTLRLFMPFRNITGASDMLVGMEKGMGRQQSMPPRASVLRGELGKHPCLALDGERSPAPSGHRYPSKECHRSGWENFWS